VVAIKTLLPGGPVHWGVMLAQGWKGELAETGRPKSWGVARKWARRAELLGFHGIWVFDHFQPYPARDDSPVLEAWTTLAALSQATDHVAIGTLVSCAAYRPAAITVKMAENLQVLSGGRFCLGLGAGWDAPEFQYLDIPFPSAAERSDRLEVVLRACRAAWSSPDPIPGAAAARPAATGAAAGGVPAGAGCGPLLLAGGAGEKRTLPAAVAYADVVNWQVGVEEFVRKSRVLAELCEAAGRDPASLVRTHAPNFQLFDSEREFARWRQSGDYGMSSKEVDSYIRNRGALYGTATSIEATIEEFTDAGCGGFMVFCNSAPALESLHQLASLPSVRRVIGHPVREFLA
jgi:alkanesulfonate monooxygenase SsuD/methylene tetrahydromethanopterin reductase-like flavin-dependent oxidoreductase (luciferase family)